MRWPWLRLSLFIGSWLTCDHLMTHFCCKWGACITGLKKTYVVASFTRSGHWHVPMCNYMDGGRDECMNWELFTPALCVCVPQAIECHWAVESILQGTPFYMPRHAACAPRSPVVDSHCSLGNNRPLQGQHSCSAASWKHGPRAARVPANVNLTWFRHLRAYSRCFT